MPLGFWLATFPRPITVIKEMRKISTISFVFDTVNPEKNLCRFIMIPFAVKLVSMDLVQPSHCPILVNVDFINVNFLVYFLCSVLKFNIYVLIWNCCYFHIYLLVPFLLNHAKSFKLLNKNLKKNVCYFYWISCERLNCIAITFSIVYFLTIYPGEHIWSKTYIRL
jgi:hypothetical protein